MLVTSSFLIWLERKGRFTSVAFRKERWERENHYFGRCFVWVVLIVLDALGFVVVILVCVIYVSLLIRFSLLLGIPNFIVFLLLFCWFLLNEKLTREYQHNIIRYRNRNQSPFPKNVSFFPSIRNLPFSGIRREQQAYLIDSIGEFPYIISG